VAVRAGRRATAVSRTAGRTVVTLDDGATVAGEELLVAVGRRPATAGLGLDHYGVTGRAVAVDDRCRAAPGLWAVGDVTGIGAFTHLAVHQAGIVVADILGDPRPPADYTALPRVTFTDPEVGSVGATEAAARAAGLPVTVGAAEVAASSRGFVHGPGNAGLVKLVVDTGRDLLVGATAVGPAGGEVLGLLALAVHARVPVATLESMILAYPTFTRGVRDALLDLRPRP
jgi:pyruvate/2-oxoglutarate dehydrogenase complex dihydrolipoamide dehydrogenase (E3) component